MSHHESLALEAGDEIVANESSTRVIQALPLRSNNIAPDIGCSSGLVDGMDGQMSGTRACLTRFA